MEFIVSRGFKLPSDKNEMESEEWFNMWQKKNFPYHELSENDTLYWFSTPEQKIVWETKVIKIEKDAYSNKQDVFNRYKRNKWASTYYGNRPDSGYFIHYQVEVVRELNVPKPNGFDFPQLGWLRVDDTVSMEWFNKPVEEGSTIDDYYISDNNKTIAEKLAEVNQKMQGIAPRKAERIVAATIRRDTPIIKLLKKAANFTCQFPGCGYQIKKRKGGYYIEVAHIKAVAKGGQSVLGNLLVLCPNHHKEFDYGDVRKLKQVGSNITGILNGNPFEINMSYTSV